MFWLNVEVTNETPQIVCSTPPFAVCLAYHWIEKATRRMVLFEGDRSGLFPGVPPHATMPSTMVIRAPGQPGEYQSDEGGKAVRDEHDDHQSRGKDQRGWGEQAVGRQSASQPAEDENGENCTDSHRAE